MDLRAGRILPALTWPANANPTIRELLMNLRREPKTIVSSIFDLNACTDTQTKSV